METDANTLIKENNDIRYNIELLSEQIRKMRETIRKNEIKIFKTCNHEWVYDTSCGPYETIKYQCKYCDLWRSRAMYS